MAAACFLDRDGVIIDEVGYLSDPGQIRVLPGSAEAIARLNGERIPVVVVTNQAGVARGYFPESRVAEVHGALDRLLESAGARIDRYEYCPHHPTAGEGPYRIDCDCRKPNPGMLVRAAAALDLDLGSSVLIGDKVSDVRAADRAGCAAILVRTGYGRQAEAELTDSDVAFIADNLGAAVERWLTDFVQSNGEVK